MRLAVSKETARPVKAPGGFPFDRPLLLLLAGAALRVLWVGWVHYQPVSDGRWCYETAKGIAAGIGYRRTAAAVIACGGAAGGSKVRSRPLTVGSPAFIVPTSMKTLQACCGKTA